MKLTMAPMMMRKGTAIRTSRDGCASRRDTLLVILAVMVTTGSGGASAGDNPPPFVMPPIMQLQAANGLSNEDILRIVARDSLMLTAREAALIDAALTEARASAATTADSGGRPNLVLRDFRLDALLYFSPTSWSIWLNGRHVTPTSVPLDMRINAITPDYVDIVWWPDIDVPHERRIFTLRPNQVYSAQTDEVLDAATLAFGAAELVPDIPQNG